MTAALSRRQLLYLLGTIGVVFAVGLASNAEPISSGEARPAGPRDILPIEANLGGESTETPRVENPIELPDFVVIAIAIALGLGALYLLSRQRFSFRLRRPAVSFARVTDVEVTEEDQADAIAEFARDLIDELNDGDSPRYAIQRAYAAVETGFGSPELTRQPAETPLRYLNRIFGRHKEVHEPLSQLTDLFQHARFSSEPVDEPMRQEAIEALQAIRSHYTRHGWTKIANRRAKANQ